jgi:hypothetical protein
MDSSEFLGPEHGQKQVPHQPGGDDSHDDFKHGLTPVHPLGDQKTSGESDHNHQNHCSIRHDELLC